jgi:hypothetical protein
VYLGTSSYEELPAVPSLQAPSDDICGKHRHWGQDLFSVSELGEPCHLAGIHVRFFEYSVAWGPGSDGPQQGHCFYLKTGRQAIECYR